MVSGARSLSRGALRILPVALVLGAGLVAVACQAQTEDDGMGGAAVGRQPTPTAPEVQMSEGRGSPMGGSVWHDEDQDGVFGPQELPADGLEVRLWRDGNGNRVCDDGGDELVSSGMTDAAGQYSLVAPVSGDYCVEVLSPSGTTLKMSEPVSLGGGQPVGMGIGLE